MLKKVSLVSLVLVLFALAPGVSAQTYNNAGSFTYQGYLEQDGVPVNETCDFTFSLYDVPTSGTPLGPAQTATSVTVTDGVFAAELSFDATNFADSDRYLEVVANCGGSNQTLSPRQPITPVPLAMALPGLRTEPTATIIRGTSVPNVIGGARNNNIAGGVYGATIGGGYNNTASGTYSTVGGGAFHDASDTYSTVVGGGDNTASGGSSTVGGGESNTASGGSSTVGGGKSNTASGGSSTVGGGEFNTASDTYSTVGGGAFNTVSGIYSTVGGGIFNNASGTVSTVGGGFENTASGEDSTVGGGFDNTASGEDSTVGGGEDNTASGLGSVIPGGTNNTAAGDHSFAAGYNAQLTAAADNTFLWNDGSYTGTILSNNRFIAISTAGAAIYTSVTNGGASLGAGVNVSAGSGTWSSASDRNLKENFEEVDADAVLEAVAAMPITRWNYISQDDEVRHIGPMAQDFYAAFGLGTDDTTISTVDADGVALAAIQGLYERVEAQEARIAELEKLNNLQRSGINGLVLVLVGIGGYWLAARRQGETT